MDTGCEFDLCCCSDTTMENWAKMDSCPWRTLELIEMCYHEQNYQSAEMICPSNRARLCKKRELEENCSADTMCEFDCELGRLQPEP